MLKKTLETPLGSKEIKPVKTKGKTDAETEFPIIWPPDVKSQLFRKDPDAGKDWRHEEKGMTEDELMSLSKFQEMVKDRQACCVAFHGVAKSWTLLSDWTMTTMS